MVPGAKVKLWDFAEVDSNERPCCTISRLGGGEETCAGESVNYTENILYLSVLQLHVQEVEVPEDPELLLAIGVIHVVLIPGTVLRGHQARLMLEQIQVPTRRKDHLRVKSPVLRRRPPHRVFGLRAHNWLRVPRVASTRLIPQVGIFRLFFYYLCWTGAFRFNSACMRQQFTPWERVQGSDRCFLDKDGGRELPACACACV